MDKSFLKKIAIIMGIYAGAIFFIPIIFKYAIFENRALSNLSNAEWAGFLGSYAGGILGGFGTLLAVYITVKSTLEIQEINRKDNDDRIELEYTRHQEEVNAENKRREQERAIELGESQKRDRRQFVNGLAKELGVYITHISKYHYAAINAERIENRVNSLSDKLTEAERKLLLIDGKLKEVNTDSETDMLGLSFEKDRINDEKERIRRKYDEALEEQRSNSEQGNRLIANENYFTLKVLLGSINEAESFLDKLEEVHSGAGLKHGLDDQQGKWIGLKTSELIKAFDEFMDDYV